MSRWPRAELEEMVARYELANREAEEKRDWRPIGEFYTDDCKYAWCEGQKEDAVLVGREEIARVVMGIEMAGFDEDEWIFPYQRFLIDEELGEVVGFYKYYSGKKRADGSNYEARGIHGSWFHYAGNFKWDWQRDFLDYGNLRELCVEMVGDGAIGEKFKARLEVYDKARADGELVVGHVRADQGPHKLWDLAEPPYTPTR
jgi:hypothetical protein